MRARAKARHKAFKAKQKAFRKKKKSKKSKKCDLRFKFNIMPLTNMHLLRDDLAEVAYFVKELQA